MASNMKASPAPMCIQLALFLPTALGRLILVALAVVAGLAIPESLDVLSQKQVAASYPQYAITIALAVSIVAVAVFLLVDGATRLRRARTMQQLGVTAGMSWVLVLLLLQLAAGASILVWWSGSHATIFGLPQPDDATDHTTWMLLATVGCAAFAAVLLTVEGLLRACCSKYTNTTLADLPSPEETRNTRTFPEYDDDELGHGGGYDDPTVDDQFLEKYVKSIGGEASTLNFDDKSKQPRYATEAWSNPY